MWLNSFLHERIPHTFLLHKVFEEIQNYVYKDTGDWHFWDKLNNYQALNSNI